MVKRAGVVVEANGKNVMLSRSSDYAISNHLQDEFEISDWRTVIDARDIRIWVVHQDNDKQGCNHFYIAQTIEWDYVDHREDTVID